MSVETLIDQFATGYQRTEVYQSPQHAFRWVRTPGTDRCTPPATPGSDAAGALAPLRAGSVRLSMPRAIGGTLHYTAPGAASVAKLLLGAVTAGDRRWLAPILHETGRLLRMLHTDTRSSLAPRTGPPGPARLAAWMDSGTGPRAAGLLHSEMHRGLGTERWMIVRAWCRSLTATPAQECLLHGAVSTGSLIPGTGPGEAVLLAGEEIARGPAEFDVGWLLGEFLEFRLIAAHEGHAMPLLTELPAVFLSGYKTPPARSAIGRAAVLRVMTHAHDFAAYVGWHPQLALFIAALPGYIDTEGRAALDGSV